MNGILKEKDILTLYDYLYEYENNIKDKKGEFNIYDKTIVKFKTDYRIFFGSIKNEKDKKKSKQFENYFLWSEGAIRNKKAKIDRAHALLRRIRNAFAHANIVDCQDGFFKLRDEDDKGETLDGKISCNLLYIFIEELKNTNSKKLI